MGNGKDTAKPKGTSRKSSGSSKKPKSNRGANTASGMQAFRI